MTSQTPKILKTDALGVFNGSVLQLSEFLDIKPAAIYQWGDYVPKLRAFQLMQKFPNLVPKP